MRESCHHRAIEDVDQLVKAEEEKGTGRGVQIQAGMRGENGKIEEYERRERSEERVLVASTLHLGE